MSKIDHYVRRHPMTGELLDLERIVEDEQGLRGESWLLGAWVPSESAVESVFGIGGPTDYIDESEVAQYQRAVDERYQRLKDAWEEKKKGK